MTVHPVANEASICYLAERLKTAELNLAVAVGNLAWKDAVIAGLESQLVEARKPKRKTTAAK